MRNSAISLLFISGIAIGQVTAPVPNTLPAPSAGFPETGEQSIVILSVVDGDTVHAAYIVPIQPGIRIWGINAPEIGTPEGKIAKTYLSNLFGINPILKAKLGGREKYGRMLADIQLKDGTMLSDTMIKSGNAKAYNGHGPRP